MDVLVYDLNSLFFEFTPFVVFCQYLIPPFLLLLVFFDLGKIRVDFTSFSPGM